MAIAKQVVTIGDIFVDSVSDLTLNKEYKSIQDGILSNGNIFTSIALEMGGSGLQFAIAAKEAGFDVSTLIGKIGGKIDDAQDTVPDLQGKLVVEYLKKHQIRYLLATDFEAETGRIVVIYLPNNKRFMLSDPLANASLSPDDITKEMITSVREADLVHVSGYTLLQPNRHATILQLLHYAREGEAKIALDIVPHDIYNYVSLAQLESEFKGAIDCGIVTIPTAFRLVHHRQLSEATPDVINNLMTRLRLIFPSVVLYINSGYAIVNDRGNCFENRIDYEPGTASRGQSATAQARLLYQFLNE